MERFKKIYHQGTIDVIEIWVDTETGVNYVFHRNGNAAGFTPLLDKDGKPIVEYYGAAEPPVRCGVSHLSGLTEPPVYSYSA